MTCWFVMRPARQEDAEVGPWPRCPRPPCWRLRESAVSCDEHAIHRDVPGLWEYVGGEARQGVLL